MSFAEREQIAVGLAAAQSQAAIARDLSVHTAEGLDFVAAQLTGRPRETFAWNDPAEQFSQRPPCPPRARIVIGDE